MQPPALPVKHSIGALGRTPAPRVVEGMKRDGATSPLRRTSTLQARRRKEVGIPQIAVGSQCGAVFRGELRTNQRIGEQQRPVMKKNYRLNTPPIRREVRAISTGL